MTDAFFFKKADFWGNVVAGRRNNSAPKNGLFKKKGVCHRAVARETV
jgi:hypothetical protein